MNLNISYFTDSIIYLTRPGDAYVIPTGSYLGDMTNELAGFGEQSYIDEFVGAGPKNYAYRVSDGAKIVEECLKVRGITLNFANKQTVNFECIKELVQEFIDVEKVPRIKMIYEKRIARDKNRNIVTKMVQKSYRIIYNKRSLFDDYTTLPYGY